MKEDKCKNGTETENNGVNGDATKTKKKDKDENGTSTNQLNSTIEGSSQPGKVKWCTIGKTILRAQEDKELSLKKFQKKIIAEYLNRMGDAVGADETVEVLWAKCQKKLGKNPKFKIHKERIKLVA